MLSFFIAIHGRDYLGTAQLVACALNSIDSSILIFQRAQSCAGVPYFLHIIWTSEYPWIEGRTRGQTPHPNPHKRKTLIYYNHESNKHAWRGVSLLRPLVLFELLGFQHDSQQFSVVCMHTKTKMEESVVLQKLQSLKDSKTVSFANDYLKDKGCEIVCRELVNNNQVEILDFQGNDIRQKGVLAISDLIQLNPGIQTSVFFNLHFTHATPSIIIICWGIG